MALRNQPYIPLYVQDFMTDEKLRECSAGAIGVYVFIMCLMHKSEHYGKIVLKQKDKQEDEQLLNFAYKLDKHLPFNRKTICEGLDELIEEKVVEIDGDYLIQKRMVKDNLTSEAKSRAGKRSQEVQRPKRKSVQTTVQTKSQTLSENEIVVEYEDVSLKLRKESEETIIPTKENFISYAKEKLGELYPHYNLSVELKYESWLENGWRTGGEKPRDIKNWKTTLLNTLPHLKEIKKAKSEGGGAMSALLKKHNI